MFTALLTAEGHSVEVAEDGQQALQLLNQLSPDLLILDMIMPGLSGLEVLEAIANNQSTTDIPVIVSSTVNEVDKIARCIDLGAVDFLVKPINRELLLARVRNTLHFLQQRKIRDISALSAQRERDTLNSILRSLMPGMIAEEFKSIGYIVPRQSAETSVMFADLSGFTGFCHDRSAAEAVEKLDEVMGKFEEIARRNRVEKIKIVGDAFLGVSGLLVKRPLPVYDCVRAGLEMVELVARKHVEFGLRVGIHFGELMAGAIGR